jgi:DNA mismatch endonuclease, patch repair protein
MDNVNIDARSENMRRIKGRDTAPEIVVRRLIHSLGFRFRLHRKDIPGCPDLAFIAKRKVIFVHGCFWHQHKTCKAGRLPKSNIEYWSTKLDRNKRRDRRVVAELRKEGWQTLVIWECQTQHRASLLRCLESFLDGWPGQAP